MVCLFETGEGEGAGDEETGGWVRGGRGLVGVEGAAVVAGGTEAVAGGLLVEVLNGRRGEEWCGGRRVGGRDVV